MHYDLVLSNVFGFSNMRPITGINQQEEAAAAAVVGGQGVQGNNSFAFDTVEYSGTSFLDGRNVRGIDLWTMINGRVYSITYLQLNRFILSTYLPLIQQMINSFEIIGGGDTTTSTTTTIATTNTSPSNNISDTAPR